MRRIMKFALVCALAVVALVGITSAASARNGIGLVGGRALTVTARGSATLLASGVNIICTVDLVLSVNATINKSIGASVGTALRTGSSISNCNGGYSGTIDADIPVAYTSWTGTLPTGITGANGVASGALFTMTGGTVFGANLCQYTGNPTVTLSGGTGTAFSRGSFTGSVSTSNPRCPPTARITNSLLSLYGTLTSVSIVLI